MNQIPRRQQLATIYGLGVTLAKALTARKLNVNFHRIYGDRQKPYAFFEIDSIGIPESVTLEALTSKDIERYLSTELGHPVRVIKGKRLMYCIMTKEA